MHQLVHASKNINNEMIINVYPNPSTGMFTVDLNKDWSGGEAKIYNVLGEKIYQSSIINNKSEIDLRKQSKGIYYLQISNSDKVVTKKIIIE